MFAGALVFMLVFNCADSSAILATTSITGCDLVSKGNNVTWGEASSFCQSMGGRLCSRKEYCPNGRNRAPLQGIKSTTESHWAPVADFSNGWVMLSNSTGDEPCAMNTEVSSDLNQNAVFNVPQGNTKIVIGSPGIDTTTLSWEAPRNNGSPLTSYGVYNKFITRKEQRLRIKSDSAMPT